MRVSTQTRVAAVIGSLAIAPAGFAQAPVNLRINRAINTTPIQHIIVIMQENRSFDSYFGTFPGANGIPPGTCVPLNPQNAALGCVPAFHDPLDYNDGGIHRATDAQVDIDDGISQALMDGFVYDETTNFHLKFQHDWGFLHHDVMGYHTAAEIPNYWAYAQNFVLQDNMFPSERGWSLANHLYLASEWSAYCTNWTKALTCYSSDDDQPAAVKETLPWASLYQLMDNYGVSWKYYVENGIEPDCEDGTESCSPVRQVSETASLWNSPPRFAYVKTQGGAYLSTHNPPVTQFFTDIAQGSLPQVSWVIPNSEFSEHPPAGVNAGMEYVTSLVNAVMQSPYWQNTAIFISWDDWGGFYDHVVPPNVDTEPGSTPILGYGIRVPGIMISAYAKSGLIDHDLLSFDSYATLAENLFMGGARLDPAALGNPDHRPDIREALTSVNLFGGGTEAVGDLLAEFDFTQAPLPPLVFPANMPINIGLTCGYTRYGPGATEFCATAKVKVTWAAPVTASAAESFTYTLLRNGVALMKCTGTAALQCIDNPPPGTYYYTVYSTDQNNVVSLPTAAALAIVPAAITAATAP